MEAVTWKQHTYDIFSIQIAILLLYTASGAQSNYRENKLNTYIKFSCSKLSSGWVYGVCKIAELIRRRRRLGIMYKYER